VVTQSDKYRISTLDHEEHAQFQAGTEFEIISNAANAQPGMQVRTAEDFAQLRLGTAHVLLLMGRERLEGASEGRAVKNPHKSNGLSFPAARSFLISFIVLR